MTSHLRLFAEIEPPHGLFEAVLARVALARRRGARLRLAAFGLVAALSSAALFEAARYTVREFYVSGFYDYFTLLISDRALTTAYTHDFVYSLLESIPSLAVLLLLGFSIVLFWSLRYATKSANAAFITLPAHG